MKMAKATEQDIDAAGNAMSVLQTISSGYYPAREGEEDAPTFFDPEDPDHLRRFYDAMNATLDASPGWPGRVIGGMCYVILYPANKIVDPDADTLELHAELTRGVAPTGEAQCIAELEAEVADVRRWYGDRLEILSAWARVSLKDEPLQTFFNIAANARPHHTDEPEWFRAVIAKLAAEQRNAGVMASGELSGLPAEIDRAAGVLVASAPEPVAMLRTMVEAWDAYWMGGRQQDAAAHFVGVVQQARALTAGVKGTPE